MSGTKVHSNYEDLITFTRASAGHALRPVSYGSELVDTANTASSWTAYGTNTIAQNGDAVEVTYVDNAGGAYIYLIPSQGTSQQLQIGTLYALTASAKVNTGSVTVEVYDGATPNQVPVTSTDYVDVQINFVVSGANPYIRLPNMGSGEVITLKDISVKEVTFDQADGTLTLFEHPDNIPRVEWDSAGNRLGLLVEESRTNLVTYSEDFTDSSWVKSGAGTGSVPTVTANYATAPDGTLTASRFVANCGVGTTSGDYSLMRFTVSSAPATLTNSLWIKSNTGSNQTVKISYGAADAVHTVTSEWQRFNIVSGNPSFADVVVRGDQTDASVDLLIWGYQAEAGSFPTSYIKSNSGSTTTRSADVASIPVADFGYNQSAGTLFVDFDMKYEESGSAFPRVVEIASESSIADRIKIQLTETTEVLAAQTYVNFNVQGTCGLGARTGGSIDSTKVAFAFREADFAASDNGDTAVTDTTGTFAPSVGRDTLAIGKQANASSNFLNGRIKSIKYYPRRLTDAQLQEITS